VSGAGEADRLDRSLVGLRTRFLGEPPAEAAVGREAPHAVPAPAGRIGHMLEAIRLRWIGFRRP
jgi:hypothetical protein